MKKENISEIEKNVQSNQNRKTFKNFDKLDLKSFAKRLLSIMDKGVQSSIGEKGSYTISLDATFGNGKTTFLEMFENFVKEEKQNYEIIFLDVWKTDLYKSPAIVILSELADYIEKNSEQLEGANKVSFQKILKVIGLLSQLGIQVNVGWFNIPISSIKILFNSIISLFGKKHAGKVVFEDFKQRKEVFLHIKEAVKKYIGSDKKLLIIVDELDRARPDYAVRFLEDMKHFFDIENVVFLVGVNKQQMEATVKCLYGQELDFDGYYLKFFKQEISMPDIYMKAQQFVDDLLEKAGVKSEKHLARQAQESFDEARGVKTLPQIRQEFSEKHVLLSCKMYRLTLREIELLMRIYENIIGNKNSNQFIWSTDPYAFFVCLYMKEKEVFQKVLDDNFKIDDYIKFIKEKEFDNFDTLINECSTAYFLRKIAYTFVNPSTKDRDMRVIQQSLQLNSQKTAAIEMEEKRIFRPIDGGFDLDDGQPALRICQRISQLESVFNQSN